MMGIREKTVKADLTYKPRRFSWKRYLRKKRRRL